MCLCVDPAGIVGWFVQLNSSASNQARSRRVLTLGGLLSLRDRGLLFFLEASMKFILAIAVLSAAVFQYLPSHVEGSQVVSAMQKHQQMIAEASK